MFGLTFSMSMSLWRQVNCVSGTCTISSYRHNPAKVPGVLEVTAKGLDLGKLPFEVLRSLCHPAQEDPARRRVSGGPNGESLVADPSRKHRSGRLRH